MLVIRADLVEEIVAHARRDHPIEACGQLVGPEDTERPERVIPMTNVDGIESDFAFSTDEDYRVQRDLTANDERTIVVYHSHTRIPRAPRTDTGLPEAWPSAKDAQYIEHEWDRHWIIVALPTPDAEYDLRSFRWSDGAVVEEDVQVVESYMFAHTGADDVPDTD